MSGSIWFLSVALSAAGALATACVHSNPEAGLHTEAAYRKAVEAWVGQPTARFTEALGYPKREQVAANGARVLEYWVLGEHDLIPQPSGPPVRRATISCNTWFELSPDGATVSKVTFKGYQCAALDPAVAAAAGLN